MLSIPILRCEKLTAFNYVDFEVVPEDEIEQMKALINDGMIHAMELKVPLTAECAIGKNWYEAK